MRALRLRPLTGAQSLPNVLTARHVMHARQWEALPASCPTVRPVTAGLLTQRPKRWDGTRLMRVPLRALEGRLTALGAFLVSQGLRASGRSLGSRTRLSLPYARQGSTLPAQKAQEGPQEDPAAAQGPRGPSGPRKARTGPHRASVALPAVTTLSPQEEAIPKTLTTMNRGAMRVVTVIIDQDGNRIVVADVVYPSKD